MSNIIRQSNNSVNSKDLKLVFMGTPEFAVPILDKLINEGLRPVAVFCAPDKSIGRKQILTPPPVKVSAGKHNLPIFQPANSRELTDTIKALACDLIVTAAYGLILSKEALGAPSYGCLNIHPSLLPKYRGASPIQSAILNGEAETGVTIYKMDEQVDHGPIVARNQIAIGKESYTTPELSEKLSALSAELLVKTLPDWFAGKIIPTPQDDVLASYTKIIKKEDGQINWRKSAKEIEQQIHAYTPWPGAYAKLKAEEKNINIKIIKAISQEESLRKQPGEIFLRDDNELAIQCGQGCLIIKKLQLEGGKPLDASDFLRGHKKIIGQILN